MIGTTRSKRKEERCSATKLVGASWPGKLNELHLNLWKIGVIWRCSWMIKFITLNSAVEGVKDRFKGSLGKNGKEAK
jgi:hypothetical protein